MKVFFAAIKMNLKTMLYYRKSFVISLFIDPINILINYALIFSIYAYNQSGNIVGYDLTQMIWYFIALNLTWHYIWNSADINISTKVISGDLAWDLQKPVSVFQNELANAIASRLLGLVFNFAPCLILYRFLIYPSFLTWMVMLKYVIIASLAFFIFFEMNYLLGLTSIVIKNNSSLRNIKYFLILLMSGAAIPLEFFPGWFNNIVKYLPFQYLFYWPIQTFLNRPGCERWENFGILILFQLFWAVILYGLCRFFWPKVLKQFCAAGG